MRPPETVMTPVEIDPVSKYMGLSVRYIFKGRQVWVECLFAGLYIFRLQCNLLLKYIHLFVSMHSYDTMRNAFVQAIQSAALFMADQVLGDIHFFFFSQYHSLLNSSIYP